MSRQSTDHESLYQHVPFIAFIISFIELFTWPGMAWHQSTREENTLEERARFERGAYFGGFCFFLIIVAGICVHAADQHWLSWLAFGAIVVVHLVLRRWALRSKLPPIVYM